MPKEVAASCTTLARPVSSAAATSKERLDPGLACLIRSRKARSTLAVKASRDGNGKAPLSWSATSSVGSSSRASGLPPVSARRRSATSSEGGRPPRCASSRRAAAGSRPAKCSTGSESGRNPPAPASPSRPAKTIATRSACSCRAANSNAFADATSSQCASSTTQRTGRSSAASVSTERVATPTRNGSTGAPAASSCPNATRSARACGDGSRSQASAGRRRRCRAANGNGASDAIPVVVRTRTAGRSLVRLDARDQVREERRLPHARITKNRQDRRLARTRRGDERGQAAHARHPVRGAPREPTLRRDLSWGGSTTSRRSGAPA